MTRLGSGPYDRGTAKSPMAIPPYACALNAAPAGNVSLPAVRWIAFADGADVSRVAGFDGGPTTPMCRVP